MPVVMNILRGNLLTDFFFYSGIEENLKRSHVLGLGTAMIPMTLSPHRYSLIDDWPPLESRKDGR